MNARMFNGNNLPHELLLTTRQTTNLRNSIENNLQTDIKLSKAQISKIIQSGGFLGKILGPLLKTGLPLLKSVIKPLGLLGLTAASSAIDTGVQKKIYGSGRTTLVISNEEMNDIMKIVQALEDSNISLKGVTKAIKNETKEQNGGFLSMLLGTLQEYYKNEARFNGVYSRDNLPKAIKNGAYVINLDEYEDAGTHWIVLYAKNNESTYFDSFGVEHIPREIY